MRSSDLTTGRRLGRVLALGAAAGLACSSLPPPPQVRTDAAETYRVGAADELAYRVLPDPAIEGTVVVRPDGRISLDLIGDVDAVGRTTQEIADEIERRIAQYRQGPLVTVSVQTATSHSIGVLGEVTRPGRFPVTEETRVADAIALAWGATKLAAKSRVRLMRWDGSRTVAYEVDLDDIEHGVGATNVVLLDGDLIYVPPAAPVAFGYELRRALYPIEALLSVISGGLVGALTAGG